MKKEFKDTPQGKRFYLLFGRQRDILEKIERIEDGLRNGKYYLKRKPSAKEKKK